jgi:tetratricopeptide (TPR) repeat protein
MVATEMFDHALWGLRPAGYHLQNLFWHAAVAVLFLLGAVAFTGSFPVGLAAAALFAVHPSHVEVVTAINYREDLLASFFTLAALLVLARRRGAPGARATAFSLLLVGVLAKESAVIAPILLALVDVLRPAGHRAERRARLLDLLVLLGAVALATGWRALVMGGVGIVSHTAEIPAPHRSLLHALPQGAWGFATGVAGLLLPVFRLSPEYDEGPVGWGVMVLVGAALLVAWRLRRRYPLLALGVLGAWVAYLPTAGLVPLSNLRADRYLYLPSLPLLLAAAGLLVAGLERVLRGPPLFELPRPWIALAVLLVVLGLRTRVQGRVWRNDLTLWSQGTAVAPRSPRAWNALAEARLRAGQRTAALEAARRSLALAEDAQGRELLGIALMESGDLTGARRELERALAASPAQHRPELLNNLGACELELGLLDQALARFAAARRLEPSYDRPWLNAARALQKASRADEALALLQQMTEAQPQSFDGWGQLGAALEERGQPAEALSAYRRALALGTPDRSVAAAVARLSP